MVDTRSGGMTQKKDGEGAMIKTDVVTTDINTGAFCLAQPGARLEGLQQIAPGRFEIKLSNVPEEAERDFLNDAPVGARSLFAAQGAIRTALTAAMRRART